MIKLSLSWKKVSAPTSSSPPRVCPPQLMALAIFFESIKSSPLSLPLAISCRKVCGKFWNKGSTCQQQEVLIRRRNFVIFSQQIHIIFALEINFLSPNVPIKCDLDILINICLGRKFENSYLKIQRRVGKFFNQLTPFVSEAISEELQSARAFLFFFSCREQEYI